MKQKHDLRTIPLNGIPALEIKQSNVRMSTLTPIDAELIKNHHILRPDGYHQTKEEEQFLELKFETLIKTGIVARAKRPV
eukprot:snap_masked-scaffold_45-processed-gene-0.54-mRNA-1 protein AED:1.00 eAED:1.00 QI:0/0/0/0/1/1/2/0/79